jgi:hyperosmotically inducible protein
MKRVLLAACVVATVAAGCNRPTAGDSAYNNSGASAMAPGAAAGAGAATGSSGTDTASPGTAAPVAPVASQSEGNAITDTVTTGRVKAAFGGDSGLKGSDISVRTENGVVVLGGTVVSQDQATAATQLAQRQEGVARVDNQIAVR